MHNAEACNNNKKKTFCVNVQICSWYFFLNMCERIVMFDHCGKEILQTRCL